MKSAHCVYKNLQEVKDHFFNQQSKRIGQFISKS